MRCVSRADEKPVLVLLPLCDQSVARCRRLLTLFFFFFFFFFFFSFLNVALSPLRFSFPEGETAYVLRLGVSNGAITSKLLLNAVTGHSYDMLNPLHRDACPMQSLALLFNADNIWANVQAEDDPAAISFDLANPALWRPFFSASFTKQMAAAQYAMKFETIQKAILYTEEPFEYFADRANKIERCVFSRSRPRIRVGTDADRGRRY